MQLFFTDKAARLLCIRISYLIVITASLIIFSIVFYNASQLTANALELRKRLGLALHVWRPRIEARALGDVVRNYTHTYITQTH